MVGYLRFDFFYLSHKLQWNTPMCDGDISFSKKKKIIFNEFWSKNWFLSIFHKRNSISAFIWQIKSIFNIASYLSRHHDKRQSKLFPSFNSCQRKFYVKTPLILNEIFVWIFIWIIFDEIELFINENLNYLLMKMTVCYYLPIQKKKGEKYGNLF